jgi:hypothetical protein
MRPIIAKNTCELTFCELILMAVSAMGTLMVTSGTEGAMSVSPCALCRGDA